MTASAVCSVSLQPVLLLVCVSNRLPTHEALENGRRFAVNVLAEGDDHLARRFATPAADKFDGVPLRPEFELPVLADAMAYFQHQLLRSGIERELRALGAREGDTVRIGTLELEWREAPEA